MNRPTEVWRKSSYSGGQNGNCVEVSNCGRVRNSRNPDGPALEFRSEAWATFVTAVKASDS